MLLNVLKWATLLFCMSSSLSLTPQEQAETGVHYTGERLAETKSLFLHI